MQAGTGNGTTVPGPTVVDIPITPFLYIPFLNNDLLIDCQIPNNSPLAGFAGTQLDASTTPAPLACRVHDSTNAGVGTIILNTGHVVTIDFLQANGLFPSFSAAPRTGTTPGLTVNFTDLSFTTALSGITSWAWDLDGIPGTDSTVQHPTWIYNTCGSYDVSLTVTDASHPGGLTLTRTNFIVTDEIAANFTVAQTAPDVYTLSTR